MNTELAVYTTVVLTYLLYGCDTWTLYRTQLKMFDQLHLKERSWTYLGNSRVPNTDVLRLSKASAINSLIVKAQLRWDGHVVRLDNSRLAKMIIFSELASGTRNTIDPIRHP